jgi:dephospho-CoA kinase
MADDSAPKSAFELAMERLRKKDAEEGVTTRRLTDEEKAAIAEVRSLYDSKIAEQEILQAAAMKQLWGADPAEREEIERRFRRERERLASERDAKVERIRRGEG